MRGCKKRFDYGFYIGCNRRLPVAEPRQLLNIFKALITYVAGRFDSILKTFGSLHKWMTGQLTRRKQGKKIPVALGYEEFAGLEPTIMIVGSNKVRVDVW